MSRFDPETYRRYRPHYPAEVFSGFLAALREQGAAELGAIVDIGCGAGHSAASFLRAGGAARVIGVDPDPAMLEEARLLVPGLETRAGTGEATGLDASSAAGILVGSALHWMHPERARDEFLRLLRPGGAILAFEYQFPKALALPELNEHVRRGFNLDWRAPDQKPRGDFAHVTRALRAAPELASDGERRLPMCVELPPDELSGLLFSQSRYLHHERTLATEARGPYREGIRSGLAAFFRGAPTAAFDFRLTTALFRRRD